MTDKNRGMHCTPSFQHAHRPSAAMHLSPLIEDGLYLQPEPSDGAS
jgi:hypothetical protein